MTAAPVFARKLKFCYCNFESQSLDSIRIHLEKQIQLLGESEFISLSGLRDPARLKADLLIVDARSIVSGHFSDWLDQFSRSITKQGDIWIPAMILSTVLWPALQPVTQKAIQMNWYFDIIHPDHIASLPIRIANLLRIHDHLHELKRYEHSLNSLDEQLEKVSLAVRTLKGTSALE
ncbi:MAG: hypothetical protein H6618_00585 [Deltaproteobacteria bacterium]|nr:hypothetical protein [Deltaproteobacteria bacterium]